MPTYVDATFLVVYITIDTLLHFGQWRLGQRAEPSGIRTTESSGALPWPLLRYFRSAPRTANRPRHIHRISLFPPNFSTVFLGTTLDSILYYIWYKGLVLLWTIISLLRQNRKWTLSSVCRAADVGRDKANESNVTVKLLVCSSCGVGESTLQSE